MNGQRSKLRDCSECRLSYYVHLARVYPEPALDPTLWICSKCKAIEFSSRKVTQESTMPTFSGRRKTDRQDVINKEYNLHLLADVAVSLYNLERSKKSTDVSNAINLSHPKQCQDEKPMDLSMKKQTEN